MGFHTESSYSQNGYNNISFALNQQSAGTLENSNFETLNKITRKAAIMEFFNLKLNVLGMGLS